MGLLHPFPKVYVCWRGPGLLDLGRSEWGQPGHKGTVAAESGLETEQTLWLGAHEYLVLGLNPALWPCLVSTALLLLVWAESPHGHPERKAQGPLQVVCWVFRGSLQPVVGGRLTGGGGEL